MRRPAPNTLLTLAVFFFKAGAFTFGSGLAIVPFLQQGAGSIRRCPAG